VPSFALDAFEPQAEAFVQARARREHQFLTGHRPGRSLVSLYDGDFPDFTSTDLWADLQAATPEDPRQLTRLSALLASANLEGKTRDFAISVTRVEVGATLSFEDQEFPWREAPARWPLISDVPRRHELEDAWRGVFRSEVRPTLERWHEALRLQLKPLGGDDWLAFWSNLRGFDPAGVSQLAQSILDQTAELYGNSVGVYLGQLDLPIDDLWTSDADWAFRASRFDALFPERVRLPAAIRVLRDLGLELEEQTNVQLEYVSHPGVMCLPLEIPADIRVLLRLVGGWQDLAHTLRGLGMAEHLANADRSLRVWERWLGDESPTYGYGFLLEGLLRDRTWLLSRLEYETSDDFRVITHLAWLYRLRRTAALAQYEQQMWRAEPGAALAAEYEELLSTATRVRHFGDDYLGVMLGAPWTTLRQATLLRAEVFAAQVRLFLKREFDEEWWRSGRAAHFIKDELWRPGRRYSAEEILGFMGYEAFDVSALLAEFQVVLQPL
jgi:hypothetical protein